MQNILKLCWAEAWLLEKIQAYGITLTKGYNECLTTMKVSVTIMSKFYVILTLAKGQSTQCQVKVVSLRGHMQNILKLCWAEAWLLMKIWANWIFLHKGDNESLNN